MNKFYLNTLGRPEDDEEFKSHLNRHDKFLFENGPICGKPWDLNDPAMMKTIGHSQHEYDQLMKSRNEFLIERERERKKEMEENIDDHMKRLNDSYKIHKNL